MNRRPLFVCECLAAMSFSLSCSQTRPDTELDHESQCLNPLSFSDPRLEAKILEALGSDGEDACLEAEELSALLSLDAYGLGITDLEGIQYLTGLERLGLASNRIEDISPLGALARLEYLDLANNPVKDISPLSGLVSIRSLNLCTVDAGDFSPLAALTNLGRFSLCETEITDIAFLFDAADMRTLFLGYNRIRDVSAIASMTELQALHLNDNELTDISAMSSLAHLGILDLSANPLSDISPLLDIEWEEGQKSAKLTGTSIDCRSELTMEALRTLKDRGVDIVCDCEM